MPNFRRTFVKNSHVFITVAINNRSRKLLTDYISELRLAFKKVKVHIQFEVHAIVILPEHFHMIIKPVQITDYPKIVSLIKMNFTKSLPPDLKTELSQEVSASKTKKRESGVWQRRFYEHTIRDESDLNHLTDYIHYNPVKHGLVQEPVHWQHSSFLKFVSDGRYDINWCHFIETENHH